MKKIIKIIVAVFMISCVLCLLIYNSESTENITNSINRCVYNVFPSLFGFMIVTTFLLESNISSKIIRPFGFIGKYILGMDNNIFSAFIFSLIGGYPAGANLVVKLYEKGSITKKQAELYSACFYCGGPAFIFGLYGSNIGKYVYLSTAISAVVTTFIFNNSRYRSSVYGNNKEKIMISSDMLIKCVNSSFIVITKVCAMIIAFSFFYVPIRKVMPLSEAAPLFEISNIAEIYFHPIIASMFFSFGGLCVVLQVKSILKDLFNVKLFMMIRIINTLLSGFIMSIMNFFIPDISVATMGKIAVTNSYQYGLLPVFVCFLMAVTLLYDSERINKKLN